MEEIIGKLQFGENGLIPAFIVEAESGEPLMLAYMSPESLRRTFESGKTCFWSRSRQEFWTKGETSGHFQKVVAIHADCDWDALLIRVEQTGVACHTGAPSCFHNLIFKEGEVQCPKS